MLIAACAFIAEANAISDYTPTSLNLKVYADGVIKVEYRVNINPALARLNITGLSTQIHNLMVKDQDHEILESSLIDGKIVVNVLGARKLVIDYNSPGLTVKNGSLWGLNVELPIEANIILPSSTTILMIQPMPLSIGILDEVTTLTMPQGNITLNYIIGIVGTKEHALLLLTDAEGTILELSKQGIMLNSSSSILEEAWLAYQSKNYIGAEELAKNAKNNAYNTAETASKASSMIESAESAIQTALEEDRTSTTDEASQKLQEARSMYDLGEYEKASNYGEEALTYANESTHPPRTINIFWILPIVGIIIITYLVLKQRKKPEIKEQITIVDIEELLANYPRLRTDEREIIRFVASSKEGVFVSEIRERFNLARSSAWRMVRRLEEMGIIETETIGRETFLKIKDSTKTE